MKKVMMKLVIGLHLHAVSLARVAHPLGALLAPHPVAGRADLVPVDGQVAALAVVQLVQAHLPAQSPREYIYYIRKLGRRRMESHITPRTDYGTRHPTTMNAAHAH